MNILLIEDDAGLVELITANLEELGFFVVSAASGEIALAHLNKQTPDLMLLDYSLPDKNGKEFIESLNKQQIPLPPFIITTGQGDERIAVDMMKLGAMDYLIKDVFFLEKIPEVIKRVIKEIESDAKLKQAEEALKQSEATIRNKLKAITEPEGDIGTLELSDIIDVEVLQSMMDNFYQLTGMLGAVLDVSGKVLVAVGWQDICTKFHRCNPDTLKNCLESDTILTQDVPEGTFKSYHCKNNMWDIVTPLMVGERHVGNVFMGQYFLEDEVPNVEFFRKQAKKYGFNEQEYLASLDRVPRFSKETVEAGMRFYSKLAGIISTLSFNSIQQSRMLAERKRGEEALRESEERLSGFMDSATDGFMLFDLELNQIDINDAALKMTRQKRADVIGKNMLQLAPDVEKSGRYAKYKEVIRTGNPIVFNDIIPHSKFGNKHVLLKAFKVGAGLGMIITDITEKIKSEEIFKTNFSLLRTAGETAKFGGWSVTIGEDSVFWSDQVAIIHGRPAGYSPLVEESINYYAPEFIETITRVFTNCIDKGIPFNEEMQIITTQGNRIWVRTTGEAIKGKQGDIVKVLGSFQDINIRKLAEQELKSNRDHLEEIVQERTKELKEKNKKLDDAMKVFVGRELTIRDLQKRIKALKS